MKIRVAHLLVQGQSAAVFAADAPSRSNTARDELLAHLINQAIASGLRVDSAALAFQVHGRTTFRGTTSLVRFLARNGVTRWTHTLEI